MLQVQALRIAGGSKYGGTQLSPPNCRDNATDGFDRKSLPILRACSLSHLPLALYTASSSFSYTLLLPLPLCFLFRNSSLPPPPPVYILFTHTFGFACVSMYIYMPRSVLECKSKSRQKRMHAATHRHLELKPTASRSNFANPFSKMIDNSDI